MSHGVRSRISTCHFRDNLWLLCCRGGTRNFHSPRRFWQVASTRVEPELEIDNSSNSNQFVAASELAIPVARTGTPYASPHFYDCIDHRLSISFCNYNLAPTTRTLSVSFPMQKYRKKLTMAETHRRRAGGSRQPAVALPLRHRMGALSLS